MVEPKLQPKEVLAHLNSLGYYDITPQQLKEFIHDLKKLIKYEQKQNDSKYKSLKLRSCDCSSVGSECNSGQLSCNESYDSSCLSHHSYSDTSSSENSLKFDEFSKRNGLPKNGVDRDLAHKAQSSFIRPWHLPSYKDLSSRSKKNLDPVDLYHQYKDMWRRQKIPGETNHSQLRWVIRSRMLGQEPQPRVII